jgi:hypothetical protein
MVRGIERRGDVGRGRVWRKGGGGGGRRGRREAGAGHQTNHPTIIIPRAF